MTTSTSLQIPDSHNFRRSFGVLNPLEHITDEQKSRMEQLRQLTTTWQMTDEERFHFIDDMCLFRYLKGLNWDLSVAGSQLKETVEWRARMKPQDINLRELETIARQGHLYVHGKDKRGRPIMYYQMGKDLIDNTEENLAMKFKFIVYMMEKAIDMMETGVYSLTWIIDAKNSNLSLSTVNSVKKTFSELGNFYTERLSRTFALNAPWHFNAIWAIVKLFLVEETKQKYIFVKGDINYVRSQICQHIDESQLIKEYGGSSTFSFDYDGLLEEDHTLREQRKAKRDSRK